jgi:hypothetical protein
MLALEPERDLRLALYSDSIILASIYPMIGIVVKNIVILGQTLSTILLQ